MFQKVFVFVQILTLALGHIIYGVLDAGKYVDYVLGPANMLQVCLISFQGPIKFAKLNSDQTLTDIIPIPGTYCYYDYPPDITEAITYRVYGSEGGATYPQYKFEFDYQYDEDRKVTDLEIYQNQTIKFRSEKGFLIIDIPLILYKNQSYIGRYESKIFLGEKQDAEILRLANVDYFDTDTTKMPKNSQTLYEEMSYSNFQTTIYIKLDPQKQFNYFAVSAGYMYLGGYEFEPNYETFSKKTWIWIMITIIVIVVLIGVLIFRTKRKQQQFRKPKKELSELSIIQLG